MGDLIFEVIFFSSWQSGRISWRLFSLSAFLSLRTLCLCSFRILSTPCQILPYPHRNPIGRSWDLFWHQSLPFKNLQCWIWRYCVFQSWLHHGVDTLIICWRLSCWVHRGWYAWVRKKLQEVSKHCSPLFLSRVGQSEAVLAGLPLRRIHLFLWIPSRLLFPDVVRFQLQIYRQMHVVVRIRF